MDQWIWIDKVANRFEIRAQKTNEKNEKKPKSTIEREKKLNIIFYSFILPSRKSEKREREKKKV